MRKGVVVFAVVAFALTGGTIYLVNNWMKSERSRLAERSKQKIEASGVYVLAASKDLPAGHIIVVADLRWQEWPEKSLLPQYVTRRGANPTDIPPNYVGTVVRRGIITGGPISNEGIIKLGDRVDVILTHEETLKSADSDRAREHKVRVSETVLQNVRVIAIDQSMDDIKTAKGDVTKPRIPKTATLEVNTKQAEIIAVAVKMGTITLAVRSLACSGTEAQAASAGDTPNCADTRALSDDPQRGKTFTPDSEVSRMTKGDANTVQIYILRGTEKAKKNDGTVTVKLPAEAIAPNQ